MNHITNVKIIILVSVFCAFAVLLAPMFQKNANAYGEQTGGWTASEKRQVISLLREIRDNTKGD